MQDVHGKVILVVLWPSCIQKYENIFNSKLYLIFGRNHLNAELQQVIFMMLNIAHFRKQIIYNCRALNCGAEVDG